MTREEEETLNKLIQLAGHPENLRNAIRVLTRRHNRPPLLDELVEYLKDRRQDAMQR